MMSLLLDLDGGDHEETDLVKSSTNINRRLLNDAVDDLGKRRKEVGGVDLWIEEDLRGEESLVADVDFVFLST